MKLIKVFCIDGSKLAGLLAASLAGGVILAANVFAQNTRPTPTPSAELPEIISRADDVQEGVLVVRDPNSPMPASDNQSDDVSSRIKDLGRRVKSLESSKEDEYDRKQKRLLLNLDILTRAEQRSESLRKQLFEMIEKEGEINTKIDGLESNLRPEMIDRSVAFAGSMKPEELRNSRRQNLESEKRNLQALLAEITRNKLTLQENVEKADFLVEKLRTKLEKEIDEALVDTEEN